MSRHAAATTAGRARAARSATPAVPRRVSGPAAPSRGADKPGKPPRSRASRAQVDGGDPRNAPPTSRARIDGGEKRGRLTSRALRPRDGDGGARPAASPVSRAPRARIDASALAYADAAVAPAPRRRAAPATRSFAPPRPRRLAYGGAAIASRMAGVAVDVSASRMMDRLVRSRVWIGVIACALIGLVAMQVSMLKLNSGIGRAVQTSSTLERSNSTLRAEISRLSAGDRITRLAEADGMVMPAPSDVKYLRADGARGDAARAAQRMHAPDPTVAPGLAGAAIEAPAPTGTTPATPTAGTTPTPTAGTTATPTAGTTTTPTAGTTATPAAGAGTGTTPTSAPTSTAQAPPAATPQQAPAPTGTAPAPTGAQPAGATAADAASGGAAPQAATTP